MAVVGASGVLVAAVSDHCAGGRRRKGGVDDAAGHACATRWFTGELVPHGAS